MVDYDLTTQIYAHKAHHSEVQEPSIYSPYVLKTSRIPGRELPIRPNHPGTDGSAHTI